MAAPRGSRGDRGDGGRLTLVRGAAGRSDELKADGVKVRRQQDAEEARRRAEEKRARRLRPRRGKRWRRRGRRRRRRPRRRRLQDRARAAEVESGGAAAAEAEKAAAEAEEREGRRRLRQKAAAAAEAAAQARRGPRRERRAETAPAAPRAEQRDRLRLLRSSTGCVRVTAKSPGSSARLQASTRAWSAGELPQLGRPPELAPWLVRLGATHWPRPDTARHGAARRAEAARLEPARLFCEPELQLDAVAITYARLPIVKVVDRQTQLQADISCGHLGSPPRACYARTCRMPRSAAASFGEALAKQRQLIRSR